VNIASQERTASVDVRYELYRSRLGRVCEAMNAGDVEALLITDPINIQYTAGATNMSVFSTRTPARYLLVFATGRTILFDFFGGEHLAVDLPTITEVRGARGLCFVSSNGSVVEESQALAAELAGIVTEELGSVGKLAIDRFRFETADALRNDGFTLVDADPVFSQARRIKTPLEVVFMRDAMQRVEAATRVFEERLRPGVTENQAWSEFHAPFIASNGHYVVSRLMQSGTRTYPYFQECSDKMIQMGDLVCLDTDVIGFEGYAVDFSRTFVAGDSKATAAQRSLYGRAREQLLHNSSLIGPGVTFEHVARNAWTIPSEHQASRYYCIGHGLGMSGEYPNLPYATPGEPYPLNDTFQPGMVFCVESYVGSAETGQGVKLEDQLLITDTGVEVMNSYHFDARLG
jgi:Xaa-Pro dipeptidase